MRSRIGTLVLSLMLLTSGSTHAADLQQIRAANIGAQALVTVVAALVQHKIHDRIDVLRCLGAGALSGYGFYEAKMMVRRGDDRAAWIVSNAAASIAENASAGKNPFAQIGYSIGPLRLRVPIGPLDPTADSHAFVDVSAYEAFSFFKAVRDNDRIRFRSGMFVFERDTRYAPGEVGATWGMFPGVFVNGPRPQKTWRHETIHAIQSLQADSVEPSLPLLTYRPLRRPGDPKRTIRFEHLKAGAVNAVNNLALQQQPYKDRWVEIEAFRVAEDESPPR